MGELKKFVKFLSIGKFLTADPRKIENFVLNLPANGGILIVRE